MAEVVEEEESGQASEETSDTPHVVYVSPDGTQQYVVSEGMEGEEGQATVNELSYVIQKVGDDEDAEAEEQDDDQGMQGMVQMEMTNEDGSSTIVLIPANMVQGLSNAAVVDEAEDTAAGEQVSVIQTDDGEAIGDDGEEHQFIIVQSEDDGETVSVIPHGSLPIEQMNAHHSTSTTGSAPQFTFQKTEDGDFIVIPMLPPQGENAGGAETMRTDDAAAAVTDQHDAQSGAGGDHGYCSDGKSSNPNQPEVSNSGESEHAYSLLDEESETGERRIKVVPSSSDDSTQFSVVSITKPGTSGHVNVIRKFVVPNPVVESIPTSAASTIEDSDSHMAQPTPQEVDAAPTNPESVRSNESDRETYAVISRKCHLCRLIFCSKQALVDHMQQMHKIIVQDVPLADDPSAYDLKTGRCKLCSAKFNRQKLLKPHMKENHSITVNLQAIKELEPFWMCEACPYVASLESMLDQHFEAKHTDSKARVGDDTTGKKALPADSNQNDVPVETPKKKNASSADVMLETPKKKSASSAEEEKATVDEQTSDSRSKVPDPTSSKNMSEKKPADKAISEEPKRSGFAGGNVTLTPLGKTKGQTGEAEPYTLKSPVKRPNVKPKGADSPNPVVVIQGGSVINFANTFDMASRACNLCDMTFKTELELSHHMASIHSVAVPIESSLKVEKDTDDDAKTFDTRQRKCCTCELRFISVAQLRKHMRDRHGVDIETNSQPIISQPRVSLTRLTSQEMNKINTPDKRKLEVSGEDKDAKKVKLSPATRATGSNKSKINLTKKNSVSVNKTASSDSKIQGKENNSDKQSENDDCEIVTDAGSFTCKVCSLSFPLSKYLRRHILKEHVMKSQLPPGEFDREENDSTDKKTISFNELACNICDRSFKNPRSLRQHMNLVHSICLEWDEEVRREFAEAAQGAGSVREYDASQAKCCICDIRFARGRILKQHMKNIHEIRISLETDDGLISPDKGYQESKSASHTPVVSTPKRQDEESELDGDQSLPYDLELRRCNLCKRTMSYHYGLKRHMREQHMVEVVMTPGFKTERAPEEPTRKEINMYRNMYNLRLKKCAICCVKFKKGYNLKRHMWNKHRMNISLKTSPNTREIKDEEHLMQDQSGEEMDHSNTEDLQHPEKAADDSVCEDPDEEEGDTHDVSRRRCIICNFKFARVHGLKRHMQNKHKIEVDLKSAEPPKMNPSDNDDDDNGGDDDDEGMAIPNISKEAADDMFDMKEKRCNICGIVFKRPYNLRRHVESTHKLRIDTSEKHAFSDELEAGLDYSITRLKCHLCDLGFSQIQALRRHMRMTHDQKVHANGLTRKQQLPTIGNDETDIPETGEGDQGENEGERHTSDVSKRYDMNTRSCLICCSIFARVQSLRTHMKSCHNVIIDVAEWSTLRLGQNYADVPFTGGPEKPTNISKDADGDDGDAMVKEEQDSEWFNRYDAKQLKCNICDVFFARLTNLRRHMKMSHKMHIYSSDIPKVARANPKFHCGECFINFETSSGLRRHNLRKHSQVKCLRCKVTFDDAAMFEKHECEPHAENNLSITSDSGGQSEVGSVGDAAVEESTITGACNMLIDSQSNEATITHDLIKRQCLLCRAAFAHVKSLKRHMANIHEVQVDPRRVNLLEREKIKNEVLHVILSSDQHSKPAEAGCGSSIPEASASKDGDGEMQTTVVQDPSTIGSDVISVSQSVIQPPSDATNTVMVVNDGNEAVADDASTDPNTDPNNGTVVEYVEESKIIEPKSDPDATTPLVGPSQVLVPITDMEGNLISIPESGAVDGQEGAVDVVVENDISTLLAGDDMSVDLSDAIASLSGNDLSCPVCSVSFPKLSTLRAHIKMHTVTAQYQCAVCQADFKDTRALNKHMNEHRIARGFKCALCGKTFKTAGTLRSHNLSHTGARPYKCTYENCSAAYSTTSRLKRHVDQVHLDYRPFACQVCPKAYRYQSELDIHMRKHTGDRPYQCTQCDKSFSIQGSLNVHVLQAHSTEKPFQCGVCGKHFARAPDINKHMKLKHTTTPTEHKCDICGQEFKEKAGLKAHRVIHAYDPNKPFVCDVCHKGFMRKPDMQRHKLIHTERYAFLCSMCPRAFKDKNSLKTHLRIHSGERPFKCRVGDCERHFTNSSGRHLHERTHFDVRPFQCQFCPKAFKDPSHLRRHHMVHTGEHKPCSVCGKKFSDSSSMRRHMRVHTGERPYVCGVCDQTFKDASHLRVHMRKHTGERPYICDFPTTGPNATCIESASGEVLEVCGKTFVSYTHLKYHKMSHYERHLKCNKCDRRFRRSNQLQNHMRSHRDDHLAYKCTICGKQCRKLGYLKNHLRTHTADKYACNGCDKVFKSEKGRLKHSITYNCGDVKIPIQDSVLEVETVDETVDEPQTASEKITEVMEVAVEGAVDSQEVLMEDIVIESVGEIYFETAE